MWICQLFDFTYVTVILKYLLSQTLYIKQINLLLVRDDQHKTLIGNSTFKFELPSEIENKSFVINLFYSLKKYSIYHVSNEYLEVG